MHPKVSCLIESGCLLGEGPVWDERERLLWWVDIKAPAIHRIAPQTGEHRSWRAPEAVSALALRERGGWMQLALRAGHSKLRLDSRIEDFGKIVARAARAARQRGLPLNPSTTASLAALGLGGASWEER